MTFLQPQFLYGLLALAIPVVIHLFDFRRTKKVYFSDTQFLNQVKESTSSLYRLKHLLVLFSRLLFIALLVMAFAQPYIPTGNGEGLKANTVGIYLDNSLSMSNEVDSEYSGLDQAKQVASEIINLYPTDTEFRLITDSHFGAPRISVGRQEILEQIASLDYSESFRENAQIIEMMTEDKLLKEIYLLTDFQASTNTQSIESGDSLAKFFLIPTTFRSEKNVFIDTIFVDNPFVLEKEKVVLKAFVKNTSQQEVTDMPIKLFLNERQLSATTISIDAGSTLEVPFDLGFGLDNTNKGVITLDDFPVVFDNDFYFNLNLGRKVKVLEIYESGASNYVRDVYANPDLFDFSRTLSNNVDYSLIPSSDLIVVNELTRITPELLSRLVGFRASGGSILVIPSENSEILSFGGLVSGLSTRNLTERLSMRNPNFQSPFFSNILIEQNERVQMPEALPVWGWGTDRNAILTLQDGSPFLSQIGQGIIMMASPLNTEFTGLAQHALFVPIMYRLAAVSGIKDQPLYYRLSNSEISLIADSVQRNVRLELVGAESTLIPDQFVSGKSISISLMDGLLRAGHYKLRSGEKNIANLALNNAQDESDIRVMSPNEIREQFGSLNYDYYLPGSAENVSQQIANKYKGISLWRYALSLSLLFLFLEVLFIRLL